MSTSVIPPIVACGATLALLCAAWYTDAKTRTIPNFIPVGIFICGFFTALPGPYKIISFWVLALTLFIASLLTKQKSGGGDIKLYCALSFSQGMVVTAILLIGAILGYSVVSLVRRHRPSRGERIPAAAYIAPVYLVYFIWMCTQLGG